MSGGSSWASGIVQRCVLINVAARDRAAVRRSAASCCIPPRSRAGGSGATRYRVRRLARGGRPVVVAAAAARAARRDRLAVRRAVGVRRAGPGCSPTRTRRSPRTSSSDFVARAAVLDRRLGALRGRRARSPTRCGSSASGARSATYARERGVRLIGDVPIYVAAGGADEAAQPELFQHGVVAGAPPDRCTRTASTGATRSTTGRRCARDGIPLVDRALPPHVRARRRRAHRPLPRLRRVLGDARAAPKTARGGRWRRGPGRELFDAPPSASSASCPLVAEDLGVITPRGRGGCATSSGLPGMARPRSSASRRPPSNPHAPGEPPRHRSSTRARTTHDTRSGWWQTAAGRSTRARLDRSRPRREPHWALIDLALGVARRARDRPGAGRARARQRGAHEPPRHGRRQLAWRLEPGQLTAELAERLRGLTERHGRLAVPLAMPGDPA